MNYFEFFSFDFTGSKLSILLSLISKRVCTFSALAGVSIGSVCALGAIFAWRAGTLVDVYLAKVPSEACKNNKRVLLCACLCVCVCVCAAVATVFSLFPKTGPTHNPEPVL